MNYLLLIISPLLLFISCKKEETTDTTQTSIQYTFPEESEEHEGTWLQWPHHHQYGFEFRNRMDLPGLV